MKFYFVAKVSNFIARWIHMTNHVNFILVLLSSISCYIIVIKIKYFEFLIYMLIYLGGKIWAFH